MGNCVTGWNEHFFFSIFVLQEEEEEEEKSRRMNAAASWHQVEIKICSLFVIPTNRQLA